MRVELGPVTKATEEKFWLEVAIPFAIPDGETITGLLVQAIQRKKGGPVVYTTDELFSVTPETEIDTATNVVRARLIADAVPTTAGEHLVEFEVTTDAGTKFEIETLLNVVTERTPVLFVAKKEQETFPVGVDFGDALASGETVTAGAVESIDKFAQTDTTLVLFTSGTGQVTGSLVTGQTKSLSDGSQIETHMAKITATTSDTNILIEWVEVEVEASQATEP